MLELRRPTLADKSTVLALIKAFEGSQSVYDSFIWQSDPFDYEDWLAVNQMAEMGLNISENWVPSIQLVGFVQDKAVGFVNLRLRLNEHLLKKGGHIGYSVAPSERGKGYAKEMLRQAVRFAGSKNISPALVTCEEGNQVSRAVILANGGALEDSCDGIERYWIT